MNQKQYTITINGVSESISQIDALLAKLNEIENRLKNINTSSLNTSSAKQTSSATGTEVKQQEEVAQATRTAAEENQRNLEALVGINRQLAENTNLQKEAMEIADRILGSNQQLHEINEQYKKDLEAIKLDRKEIDALEKYGQISAEEALERRTQLSQKEMEIKTARQQNLVVLRNEQKLLSAEEGSYEQISYTLSRLKEALKQVNAGNLSPEDFQKLAGAIDETDRKAKAMAASMGEFQRNVGNYPSAFEGIEGIKIKIGDVEAEFGSAIEASKKLRTAMLQLALEGKDDTEQWHQYEDAVNQVEMAQIKVKDAFDRAKDASAGLHDVIEMFEGMASITAVGQGVSNLFGIDDGEIQKKIQQMTSLIAVMNGLQKLSTQMATGTGIGPILNKLFEFTGKSPVEMLKNVRDQLKGMFAESEQASGGFLKMGNVMNNLKSIASGLWKGLVGGLATGGVMMAIDFAISGVQTLIDKIQKAISVEDDMQRSIQGYTSSVNANNEALKYNIQLIEQKSKLEGTGPIETEQQNVDATVKSLEQYSVVLKQTIDKLNQLNNTNYKGGVREVIDFSNEDINAINNEIIELNKNLTDGAGVQDQLKTKSAQLANAMIAYWLKMNKSSEDAHNGFLNMANGLDGVKMAIANLDNQGEFFVGLRQALLDVIEKSQSASLAFFNLKVQMRETDKSLANSITDAAVNAIEDKTQRTVAQLEVARQRAIDEANRQAKDRKLSKAATEAWIADINKAYDRQQKEATQTDKKVSSSATNLRKTRVNEAERTARELAQIEKQIALDKINAMRDGLTKSLELIKREREERLKALEKFKGTDKYNTLVEDTNAIFDDKEAKARMEFMKEYTKAWGELEFHIREIKHEFLETSRGLSDMRSENNKYSVEQQKNIEFINKTLENATFKYKQYHTLLQQVTNQQKNIELMMKGPVSIDGSEPQMFTLQEIAKQYEEYYKNVEKLSELTEELSNFKVNADDQKQSLKDWSEYYQMRFTMLDDYNREALDASKKAIKEQFDFEREQLKKRKKEELDAIDERYHNLVVDTEGLKEIGKTQKQVMKEWEDKKLEVDMYYTNMIAFNNMRMQEELLATDQEYDEKRISETENFYDNLIGENDKYANYVMNTASELEKRNTNAWGIINISKLKSQRKDAEREIDELIKKFRGIQIAMRAMAQIGMISPDAFKKFNDELDNTISKLKDSKEELKKNDPIGAFISSINTYIQEVGNAVSTILSSVYDYQESLLDAEEDALDKENEMLENKLSEQEEITRKHKEAMDEIESELQTARGDRRDALIDQLNAEVSAQRASLANEKRIKQQQEALQKKQDALDLKRKKMQQQQSKTQAIISGALAISNALSTQPFVPVGLAMGALAAAMTAVQIATIAKQKFASGGKIEGASHERGGVDIEAEGGEYIVNKHSYSRNAELVELINSVGRRLTISDLNSIGYDFPSSIETNQDRIVVMPEQQEIWVSVTDINRVNSRMAKVKEMSR